MRGMKQLWWIVPLLVTFVGPFIRRKCTTCDGSGKYILGVDCFACRGTGRK